MQNKNYNRPLPPVALSVIFGLVIGLFFPGAIIVSTGIATSAIVAIIVCSFINKRLKFTPLILFVATGYLLIQPHVDFKHVKDHITSYADDSKYLISGSVESRPVKKNRRYRFILKTKSIVGNDFVTRPTSGKINVSVYGDNLTLKKGDSITFKSKIRLFRNFKNPGAFDYERFMAFKDIWGSAYVSINKLEVNHFSKPSPVTVVQNSIIKLISGNVESDDAQSILKALIVGKKQSIRAELREAFNRTGTGHLLAISGLHIGIVAVFSYTFFCFLLSFSSRLLWSGKILSIAGLMALFPVFAYGLVAGMSPSTQRAVIMVSVLLLSYSFCAEYDLVNTLSLAALIILVVSPVSLFSVSFQLSFTAVCAITAGVLLLNVDADSKRNDSEKTLLQRLNIKLTSYITISFLAYTGTLPIVIYYFNQFSLIGMLANFVLIPIIGFFVVPFSLLAVTMSSVSPSAGGMLIKVTGFVLEKSLLLIQYLADLPFASVKMVTPSVIEIICYYLFFFLILYVVYKKKSGDKISLNGIKVVSAIVLLVIVVESSFVLHKRFFHNSFRVTIIDVGQGSSALLEFPDGKTMLIDGGGFNDNKSFDVGEKIIAPFLWKKRIRTVDTIVLTHPESDHLNGLLYVVENFNVKTVWSNGQGRRLKGYATFQNSIKRKKIQHQLFKELNKKLLHDGVLLEILYPFDDFIEKQKEDKWRNTNNNSLVVRVEYQGISFLFPGDIMKKAEAELADQVGDSLKSTVLIVPHHGSKTSSSNEFLNKVQPVYATISAGWKNRFHMPHVSVLARLKKAGTKIFRTDKKGAVVMTVKDHFFNIETETD